MPRILLVESHFRTRSWFEGLKNCGELFIISILKGELSHFYKMGVPKESILNLDKFQYTPMTSADYTELGGYEDQYSMNINEIVSMDRTLRLNTESYLNAYCLFLIQNIERFIKQIAPQIVFLEPTWTHELLLVKICEKMNIPVYAPTRDKILMNRTFFFKGYERVSPFRRAGNDMVNIGAKTIEAVNASKPQYFRKYTKRNKIEIGKLGNLFKLIHRKIVGNHNKHIQPRLLPFLVKKSFDICRAYLYMRLLDFRDISNESRGVILLTLHVQPEAGIDVVGARFSNQYEFIRQVCRSVPATHLLVVKEHPHDFGRRKIEFYRSLASLPNVVLVSPFEESKTLIKRADLVISTAGTSSLEAAIMGIPAVTAVKMYFHSLMVYPSFDPFAESVTDLLKDAGDWKLRCRVEDTVKLVEEIQQHSFAGNFLDYTTDTSILCESNISALEMAFKEVVSAQVHLP